MKRLNLDCKQRAALKLMLFLSAAFCFTGCTKQGVQGAKPALYSATLNMSSALSTTPCCWISTTNDADLKVDVWDPADNPWTTSNMKWSWEPTTALGYNATTEIPLWSGPSDVKVRNNTVFGGSQVIIASAGRLATIASYPGGVHKWAVGFPTGVDIHGVELLPSGNCVVAAASGNYIRIYSSSQPSPNDKVNNIYTLTTAHAVLWDNTHNCLWALGNVLNKYTVGASLTNPTLSLVSSYTLPTAWGHDLSAYTYDSNLMWVSTNGGTYIFNKSAGTFTTTPGASENIFVKGLSDQPSPSQIVETIMDNTGCTLNGWCTHTVTFFDLTTGAQVATRTVSSAAFYKGKSFDPNYY